MKPLSKRLEDLASREYVVGVGVMGTVVDDVFDADTQELIREAAALAKRYEDALVGFVMGQGLLTEGKAAIVSMEDPAPVKGHRVRIVLDKEG